MSISFAPFIAQLMGIIIIAAVVVLVILLVVSALRRIFYEQKLNHLSLELLNHRVEAALNHRLEREDEKYLWQGFRKFEVERKVNECNNIYSFYLKPHDRKQLPSFQPGQYLTFQLKIPGQIRPTIRCYSLSDSPGSEYYRVTIKKVLPPPGVSDTPPGLASSFFHDQVKEDDILDVKAPSGKFTIDMTNETPVVLIGGGVGITPVLSMLNAIIANGLNRETWFFLGVRNGKDHPMREHLDRLAQENDNMHLRVCYSKPGKDDLDGTHYHHAERVTVDLLKRLLPSNNYAFYTCGPATFMDSITHGLKEWGVPDEKNMYETFGPASVKKVAAAESESGVSDLMVNFGKSGKECSWNPGATSLLEFAEENGVVMDYGCRAGNCGTCLTAIKSGEVHYLHEPGTETEAGACLACIAVPKSNLDMDA